MQSLLKLQQRTWVGLTDEQILELNFDGEFCTLCDDDEAILDFARAIEAAHGIKENT
jgi:hypothetical protein